MHIKQVIIRGFKTYKDQTALEEDFSPGANAIVGFNGAGKSNFFQAILFVLSDQYSTLRAETRKALLHEGAGQAVLTAYVEIVLDNLDHRIPIESDTVSIRRLIGMKKDDWLLDGKHTTKAEVFGLLEGAGFTKTSPYYIVQQGKVSELALMNDAQRLNLLQDISGAGVYDERRLESVKIMEDTSTRRTRTDELVGEIEQRLAVLETEQSELQECEQLEMRRRALEYLLADSEWHLAQNRIEELESRCTEAARKLAEQQQVASALRERVATTEAAVQQREEERRRTGESIAELEKERGSAMEALAQARLEADDGARGRRESEERCAARVSEIEHVRSELAKASSELDSERPQVEAAEERLRSLERRQQDVSMQRQQLLARQGRRQQYGSVEERNAALGEEVRRSTMTLKQARRTRDESDEKLRTLQASQATSQAAAQRQALAQVEGRLATLGQESRRLGAAMEASSEKVRLLHQERSKASQRVDQLRQEAVSVQNRLQGTLPRAHRQAIQAVMHWAEEQPGMRERIRGPLLNHIEVHSTFRVAVESFAGMALFNVLAMDDDAAAQALKLVRSRHLGSLVVTPLNQLRTRRPNYPRLDGVKPLVDAITCPDWVLPSVQQIFGRAVVCRTMELCEEVARTHGLDAITLDGDRISRRGVVSGGYHDPQHCQRLALAASIKSLHTKVAEAEAGMPALEQQIQASVGALDALHAERLKLHQERDGNRAEVQQRTQQIQALEVAHAKQSRDADELRKRCHGIDVMIVELETSIEAKRTEMQTKTLSSVSKGDEDVLRKLDGEEQQLNKEHETTAQKCRERRSALEQRHAHVEDFLRKKLHQLELEAVQGSQDEALDRADHALQTRARLEQEHQETSNKLSAANRALEALTREFGEMKIALEELTVQEQQAQEQVATTTVHVGELRSEVKVHTERKADVDAKLKGLAAPVVDVERSRRLPQDQLVKELAELGKSLQRFQNVNRKAVEQYENFAQQLVDLRTRKEDIDAAETLITEALERIDAQKEATLLQTLRRVNDQFQQVFSELVPGGTGKLQIVRDADTEATMESQGTNRLGSLLGVRVIVSFTGQAQSFLSMNQLSGGQKTVVALSLIFAIQRLEPAPFYLLDEVDAALDASYRSALANLVGKTAKSSQVILTTFRPEVLESADKCYRVYQQNRASRIDVVAPDQAKQVLREQDRISSAMLGAGA